MMTITRTNLILMAVNLLVLGLMLGIGLMWCHRPGDMPGRFGQRFGPAFQSSLERTVLTAEPNWKQDLAKAHADLQATIAAPNFNEADFRQASARFDRLMDEFHAIMQQQMHEYIIGASPDERQRIAHTMGEMPLPLADAKRGDMPPPR